MYASISPTDASPAFVIDDEDLESVSLTRSSDEAERTPLLSKGTKATLTLDVKNAKWTNALSYAGPLLLGASFCLSQCTDDFNLKAVAYLGGVVGWVFSVYTICAKNTRIDQYRSAMTPFLSAKSTTPTPDLESGH